MLYMILLVICIIFPEITINTTKETIGIWSKNVLPSLLPFFIISRCICYSGGIDLFSKLLKPIMKFLHLDKNIALPFSMSILCGYQTGCSTVNSMNLSSNKDFFGNICYCASPLFVIGTVGTSILNDTKLGYELYIIHICAFLIFTIFYVPKQQKEKITNYKIKGTISNAVTESVSAILNICGFMVLYHILIEILTLKIPQNIKVFVSGIIEFTSGITYAGDLCADPLPIISFFLSFGGICVITQCLSILKINKQEYIRNRLLTGIIAYVLCVLYEKTALCVPVIITGMIIITAHLIRRKKVFY